MRSVVAGAALAAFFSVAASPARAEGVDLALVLAADASRRVDDDEFKLRRQGHAAAVLDSRALQAIVAGAHGAIAIYFAHTQPPEGLPEYYRQNLGDGPGSFLLAVRDFNSFGEAITNKLVNDIAAARSLMHASFHASSPMGAPVSEHIHPISQEISR